MRCSCDFNSSNIIEDAFSCRGSQGQFRNTVVYRAKITLQMPASISDADNIVNIISDWVMSEPSVRVNRITLDLDHGCTAVLDSFDSDDCIAPDQTTPSSSSSSSSSSSPPVGIIVGAAVATVAILLLIIIIAIIIKYYRHKSSYRYVRIRITTPIIVISLH